jgi:hypothetical protein
MDRLGLGAGPSAVLTRCVASLHKSLCACADRPTGVGGQSAGAKMELRMNFVFFEDCTTDCLRF